MMKYEHDKHGEEEMVTTPRYFNLDQHQHHLLSESQMTQDGAKRKGKMCGVLCT